MSPTAPDAEELSRPVLVFGAGGLAADVVDIVTRAWNRPVAGFVVNRESPQETRAPDAPPIFLWSEIRARADEFLSVNAMGRPSRRAFIEEAESAGFVFRTLIDPSAQIFPSALVEPGCVIGAGCIVAAAAHIDRHVFLNRGVLIGHHTHVQPFSSIQAGARVGGHGLIEEESEIGIGATIIDRINIGARSFVAAGSVVVRDSAPDSKLLGNPARERAK